MSKNDQNHLKIGKTHDNYKNFMKINSKFSKIEIFGRYGWIFLKILRKSLKKSQFQFLTENAKDPGQITHVS